MPSPNVKRTEARAIFGTVGPSPRHGEPLIKLELFFEYFSHGSTLSPEMADALADQLRAAAAEARALTTSEKSSLKSTG